MLAPLLLFVYARPEHTKKTIESLARNYLASDTNLIIFSDAAKNEEKQKNVNLVREYIDTLPNKQLFKSVKIIKSEKNKGLANSIIDGVTEIINQYGKVIVVEDDLVSSPDFLSFMNEALNYYESIKHIWSISGYTFNIKLPNDYKSEVYLSYRGGSWGWATWKNRWEKVDWNVSDYNKFKRDKQARKKFNRGGRDMANMLDLQMEGKIDSWAIRWCYTQFKLNMYTVYPVISKIKNIGLDGTGTHSGVTNKYDVELNQKLDPISFDLPQLDRRILKEFKDQYGTRFEYSIINAKRIIKKILHL